MDRVFNLHSGISTRLIAFLFTFAFFISGCISADGDTIVPSESGGSGTAFISPSNSPSQTISPAMIAPGDFLADYAFPGVIDPAKHYLFYLHGKITEDQGIPAISPDFGEYEFQAILERLSGYGFSVISEQRPKNTDGWDYAKKVTAQVTTLLDAGVPANSITIVGASKGAGIAILISDLLRYEEVNFVIMAICNTDTVWEMKQNQVVLNGNILSIFDSSDPYAGSCMELFTMSVGNGISRYKEIVLNTGTGHGMLYRPLDEWILPTVQWAMHQQ